MFKLQWQKAESVSMIMKQMFKRFMRSQDIVEKFDKGWFRRTL